MKTKTESSEDRELEIELLRIKLAKSLGFMAGRFIC